MNPRAAVGALALIVSSATFAGDPAPPGAVVTETIEETTVGDLDGVRVPMGNMFEDTYTLPDGTQARGLVCALALEAGPVFVGRGSEVRIGSATWRVVAIEKTPGQNGSVTLTKL